MQVNFETEWYSFVDCKMGLVSGNIQISGAIQIISIYTMVNTVSTWVAMQSSC